MIKSKPHACTSSTHQACGRERQEASLTGWMLSQSKMQRKDLLNAACSQQFCTQTLCTCLTDEQAAYYFILPTNKRLFLYTKKSSKRQYQNTKLMVR